MFIRCCFYSRNHCPAFFVLRHWSFLCLCCVYCSANLKKRMCYYRWRKESFTVATQYCTVAWLEVIFCDEHVISVGAPGLVMMQQRRRRGTYKAEIYSSWNSVSFVHTEVGGIQCVTEIWTTGHFSGWDLNNRQWLVVDNLTTRLE